MSLSVAREKARQKLRDIELAGGAVLPNVPTFAEAAKKAHQARTAGYRNPKHVAQWISTLETHAFPIIGDKLVSDLTRRDVTQVLMPIWLKTPETARRVLQRIDRVLRWAVGNSYRDDRIDMSLVRDGLPKHSRKRSEIRRMPAVPYEQAPSFWASIPLSRSALEVRLGLSLLILTASRPGNIATAKAEQFDLSEGVWTIPGSEMKGGETHRVPLSAAAVAIVRAALADKRSGLLFAAGDNPMSPDTLRMMMRRMGSLETPHGFRSTFKEWARSAGWADHLSEAALAHADPNEVRAAYARSDLLEDRRPMMEAWASFLTGSAAYLGNSASEIAGGVLS